MLWMYNFFMWCLQPLVRLRLAQRARKESVYAQHIGERFGQYQQAAAPGAVWVHAVSLGETRAAAILIAQLRQDIPGMRLLLTHSTATGRAEGAHLLQPGDVQVWLPWDTRGATQRFIQHFRPRIGIVMETEVWPQLCATARTANVPLLLVNARLSEASLRKAQRIAWLARPAYASFARVCAQTEADAQRLRSLGALQVQVMGNLKFDAQPDAAQLRQGQAWRAASGRPVVMLASSREGEEQQFLEAIGAIDQVNTAQAAIKLEAKVEVEAKAGVAALNVQWLIVPRHPQRFDEVAALISQAGFSVSRRSQWGSTPTSQPLAAQVWLGDSLSEMALYYGLADCALLGGSYAQLGGQNLIEAIAVGCPMVMGPHTFNFADAATTAVEQGAAERVESMQQGVATAVQLTTRAAAHQAMQSAGGRWLAESRGATQRMALAVQQLL
jgi:3-deoxy-D-manno-octulosonic-acid transferase